MDVRVVGGIEAVDLFTADFLVCGVGGVRWRERWMDVHVEGGKESKQ
jgi:hypothetical protein